MPKRPTTTSSAGSADPARGSAKSAGVRGEYDSDALRRPRRRSPSACEPPAMHVYSSGVDCPSPPDATGLTRLARPLLKGRTSCSRRVQERSPSHFLLDVFPDAPRPGLLLTPLAWESLAYALFPVPCTRLTALAWLALAPSLPSSWLACGGRFFFFVPELRSFARTRGFSRSVSGGRLRVRASWVRLPAARGA